MKKIVPLLAIGWFFLLVLNAHAEVRFLPDAEGLVSMEAEHYTGVSSSDTHDWQEVGGAQYAGEMAMAALPNAGVAYFSGYVGASPRLDYEVEFAESGTHYVWVRGIGATEADNSVHIGLDGAAAAGGVALSGAPGTFGWLGTIMGGARCTIEVPSAGVHTVNVWMREDGFEIDKVVMTPAVDYVPLDAGPAESARSSISGIVSDDFNKCALDTGLWTFNDPVGDAAVSITGAGSGDLKLQIAVPAGPSHDAGGINEAARLMQTVNDADFEIEAKFDSLVTQGYQDQGIMVEESSSNWLRFDVYSDGFKTRLFAATVVDGSTSVQGSLVITTAVPVYLRVTRTGDVWELSYSYNGADWTSATSFSHAMTVTAAGPYAGNYDAGINAPAHTAVVDYFFDTASPIVPEDGAPLPADAVLNVTPSGSGTVTIDPDLATYTCGQGVTLTAVADAGQQFTGWSGDLTGTTNPTIIVMNGDKSITATFGTDTDPPVISNIQVFAGETSATITWQTDEPATSVVDYGETSAYEIGTLQDLELKFSHSLPITGLTLGHLYHYRITSEDGSGHSAETADLTFETPPDAPLIDIWYGNQQSFGQIGTPQRWVNILGNVSDPDGISLLQYSLNGGTASYLAIGPNNDRLVNPGDFNVEIPISDLNDGPNQLLITSTDGLGNQSSESVTINFQSGNVWPENYAIDWSTAASINDVAQVVDGLWTIEGNKVRVMEPGFDRLIAIGDMSWSDYEVTADITLHQVFPSGNPAALGILTRWQGHVADGEQPSTQWWPLGVFGHYRWDADGNGDKLKLLGKQTSLIASTSNFQFQIDVDYKFKLRSESDAGSSTYSLKIWPASETEPAAWTLVGVEAAEDQDTGSLLLLAHYVDASFGNIVVTPISGALTTYYEDADGDGYGNPAVSVQAETPPAGYVADNTDNCPYVANPGQEDSDGDGIGDVCDAPTFLQDGEGIVSMEAEHYTGVTSTDTHDWQEVSNASYAGEFAMAALPNAGVAYFSGYVGASPRLDYEVEFAESGTHYVWVRGIGATEADNSVHIGLDGAAEAGGVALSGAPGSLGWLGTIMGGARCTIEVPSAGVHTVNVWMREDGFEIDKLVVTPVPSYTPADGGPSESERFGGGLTTFYEDADDDGYGNPAVSVQAATQPAGYVADNTDNCPYVANPGQEDSDGDGIGDVCDAPTFLQDGEGIVSMEAEHYTGVTSTDTHDWQEVSNASYAGEFAMAALPNAGVAYFSGYVGASPRLDYEVEFAESGTHYVWVRGIGATEADNSVHIGLDGAAEAGGVALSGAPGSLGWLGTIMGGARCTIEVPSAGVHTVNVWMREDGFEIDKLVVTPVPSYTPADGGPSESERFGGGLTTFYEDADDDGYGNPAVSVQAATQPAGYVEDNTDNCPYMANPGQEDSDGDGIGDVCDAPTFLQDGEGIVSMEAEHYTGVTSTDTHDWQEVSNASYAGEFAMAALPNAGVAYFSGYVGASPRLDYEVEFAESGTHYVWVRGIGATEADNSVHIGLDGAAEAGGVALSGAPGSLGWLGTIMGGARCTIEVPSAGVHTVNVWMREDGFEIDKLVVTPVPSYTPADTGPAESERFGQ